jgi:hypothetical protein
MNLKSKRIELKPAEKEALVDEAGGKCANRACVVRRTDKHHIKEWAVYQTNDLKHMIAICPSCHDDIHYGKLSITDASLYSWKTQKAPKTHRDLLHIDPQEAPRLLLGSIAAAGDKRVVLWALSPQNQLSFAIEGDDLMLLNLRITTRMGDEVIRITDNRVKHSNTVTYERRTGRIRITVPNTVDFLPIWALTQMRQLSQNYASDGKLTLLDLEVLDAGLVQVQGIWSEKGNAIVVTQSHLAFCRPGLISPLAMVGEGTGSVLKYTGPVTKALFGFK